jgi:3-hydroxybutyryl-CoA dehydratase
MSRSDEAALSGAVYLDDIAVGMEGSTSRRTVTEADVVNFAGVSGDFNPLHTDDMYVAEMTPFRGRIAHGLLVLSISSGLRQETDNWQLIGWLEVQRRFVGPTYPGDTIQGHFRVEEVKRSRSKPDRGIVRLAWDVTNQHGDVVQTGSDVWMMAARNAGEEE